MRCAACAGCVWVSVGVGECRGEGGGVGERGMRCAARAG